MVNIYMWNNAYLIFWSYNVHHNTIVVYTRKWWQKILWVVVFSHVDAKDFSLCNQSNRNQQLMYMHPIYNTLYNVWMCLCRCFYVGSMHSFERMFYGLNLFGKLPKITSFLNSQHSSHLVAHFFWSIIPFFFSLCMIFWYFNPVHVLIN